MSNERLYVTLRSIRAAEAAPVPDITLTFQQASDILIGTLPSQPGAGMKGSVTSE